MEIRSFTTATIADFVSSEQFQKLKHIPISKHRALSYAHNPRSAADDKILFVAFENDEVAGYLGALPDRLFYRGEWKRMTWLSCFWIDPQFRGKGIAKELFDLAMKEWGETAIITNMKPGTLKIYERTGYFRPPAVIEGMRGYLRFNFAEVLPPRGGFYRRIKPILEIYDFSLNFINSIRLLFYPGYKLEPGIRFEYVEEISDETSAFIDSCNDRYLSRRGKPELEWINRYPWVIEQDKPDADSRRYYFSSVSKRFFYQMIEFRNAEGAVAGFLMLSIRDNHLTVPYAFFRSGMETTLVKFLFNTMLDFQLNMLTIFQPELSEEIRKKKTPFIFKKKIVKPYFLPKTMEFPELDFQDGDGDVVFT
ncbi:MAG: GNAT family N-acetyltransferase [Bacteroidetes bacterium]|nr:GNAT family N-acetyltransferase [Bacteroidota bacterium]